MQRNGYLSGTASKNTQMYSSEYTIQDQAPMRITGETETYFWILTKELFMLLRKLKKKILQKVFLSSTFRI